MPVLQQCSVPRDLETFEDWLRCHHIAATSVSEELRPILIREYERDRATRSAIDVNDVVRAAPTPGNYRYAVAIDDGTQLWLTLWFRRSPSGECFILYPGRGESDPHASYHHRGQYHHKSYRQKLALKQCQPLNKFRGTEHLGAFIGHGAGTAICHPEAFTDVMRVAPGILEPMRGRVLVDLVEPGGAPHAHHRQVPGLQIVQEQTYRHVSPWLVVAVARQVDLA